MRIGRLSKVVLVTALLAGFALVASAGNILSNPGFDTLFTGWSAHSTETWSYGSSTALIRDGAGSLWMQGLYRNGGALPYYNMYVYQTVAAAAGSTFTADAFFSQYNMDSQHEGGDNNAGSGLFTSDTSGEEDGWCEVVFLDGANNVLADYKSIIVTPTLVNNIVASGILSTNANGTYLPWIDLQVTNQYDVTTIGGLNANIDPAGGTEIVTNTLGSGQYMVAPPGTKFVQFRLAIAQAQYESGASYWDDCSLNLVGGPAPSVIANITPDGSKFFNIASSNFTFTITSASSGGAPLPTNPVNGISVNVNGVDKSGSLQLTGSSTSWNATLPGLVSNSLYNITITVSNSAGLVSTKNVVFDTFATNNFIVNVEDYDYNSGQFIQNPTHTSSPNANSYWGRAGVLGTDMSTFAGTGVLPGGSVSPTNYPNRTDYNVAFQQATDLQLPSYTAVGDSNVYEVNISYNNAGNWLNYTRNPYPSGNYQVYGRISGGQGAGVEYLNLVTSGYGTSTQTTNNLGQFTLANGTDWGHYYWIPLTDAFGNPATVNIPSGQQTLQLLSGGGENVIDFMFVPLNSGGLPPAITGLNPNVAVSNIFVSSPTLTFTVNSSTSTIKTNNIHVSFNGTDATSKETFTGTSTSWNVSVPLPSNQIISMIISATDNAGMSNSYAATFDTFSQANFTFEAEDFDFNGGSFIDNPIATGNVNTDPNSYYLYPQGNSANAAIQGVDVFTPSAVGNGAVFNYRPAELVGTEHCLDFVRTKFATNTAWDYDVGWWNPNEWMNYTRTYPSGTFNIYARLAGGGPFSGGTMSLVTSGRGTSNQVLQVLGHLSDANANGWQTWQWVPLADTNGQPVTVTLGGVQTIRVTSGGGMNGNFYMLVPAAAVANSVAIHGSVNGSQLSLSFPTQTGFNYTVQFKNTVTDANWQTLTTVPGNGSTQTVTDTLSHTQRIYRLSIQ